MAKIPEVFLKNEQIVLCFSEIIFAFRKDVKTKLNPESTDIFIKEGDKGEEEDDDEFYYSEKTKSGRALRQKTILEESDLGFREDGDDKEETKFYDITQIYFRDIFSQPLFDYKKDTLPLFMEIEGRKEKLKKIDIDLNNLKELRGKNAQENIAELSRLKVALENEILERRNKIVAGNTRLAVKIAKRHIGISSLQFSDLIQEGIIGLIKATERFEYKKDVKFSTYAVWWIKQNISRKICDQGFTIRMPVHIHKYLRKLCAVQEDFLNNNNRLPTEEELAEISGFLVERIKELKKVFLWKSVASLDAPIKNHKGKENSTLYEIIKSEKAELPESLIEDANFTKSFLEIIENTLGLKEQFVIKNRFGFAGPNMTLEEVGQIMKLSRERVRQIEDKALLKLRHQDTLKKFQEIFPDISDNDIKEIAESARQERRLKFEKYREQYEKRFK